MSKTKYPDDRFNRGYRVETVLNWLDLQYFAHSFVDGHANNSHISTDIVTFLSDVQDKAKSVVLNTSNYTLLRYDDFNKGKVKFGSEHISFIIKCLYNNNTTIQNVIRLLEQMYPFSERTMCLSFIGLYELIENSANANETFTLMPGLKFLSKQFSCIEKLQLRNGTIFQQILSENYFHLKNVYNNELLYVKQNKRVMSKGKNSFVIKTVSDSDSDKINWKFSTYRHFRSDRLLLVVKNENYERNYLLALPCLAHDNESIVQMENGKYYDDEMINQAWNIEVDDMASDRFRIRNDFTKGYLAVSMNVDRDQSNVILVNELNAENYDSVHWTLEAIN